MKRIVSLVLSVLLTFTLMGCETSPITTSDEVSDVTDTEKPNVEKSMDNNLGNVSDLKELPLIGISAGGDKDGFLEKGTEDMKRQLEAKGYRVNFKYANYDAVTQKKQIIEMINEGCDVLVIIPYFFNEPIDALKTASDKGIKIICYRNLIYNTPYVDYYISFSPYKTAAAMASFIEEKLNLKYNDGPFNIELFFGDPASSIVSLYCRGAIDVLGPYIDSGKLIVRSGKINSNNIYVTDWKSENAQAIMDEILAEYYTDARLDAVFCASDSIARGVIASLKAAGYTEFPIITGQNSAQNFEKENIKAIKDGKQTMIAFCDSHTIASKAVEMVEAIITGKEVPVNDTEENLIFFKYNHLFKFEVPAFICSPAILTVDNYKEILIGGGYYTEAELEE